MNFLQKNFHPWKSNTSEYTQSVRCLIEKPGWKHTKRYFLMSYKYFRWHDCFSHKIFQSGIIIIQSFEKLLLSKTFLQVDATLTPNILT